MYRLYSFFVMVLALMIMPVSPLFAAENNVKNPSFENGSGGMPSDWQTKGYITNPGVTDFRQEAGLAHSGKSYVTIVNNTENDAKFSQDVPVMENRMYKISCWIKTENVGTKNKGANIGIEGKMETSPEIKGTNGKWEYVEMYAKVGQAINSIRIIAGIGGYGSMNTGKASFDDVAVEEVTAMPEGAVVSSVNVEKPAGTTNVPGQKSGLEIFFWGLLTGVVITGAGAGVFYKVRLKGTRNGTAKSGGQVEAKEVKNSQSALPKSVKKHDGDDLV
jgi:dolichyl-phosphate-mannose-protein mannosyltransferase